MYGWSFHGVLQPAAVRHDTHHEAAAWQIACQNQRVSLAVRALAGLAAASKKEDQYGVVQLSHPSLGTVLQRLLSLLLALQQHLRTGASHGRRHHPSPATGE